jgi:glutathione S-transferase
MSLTFYYAPMSTAEITHLVLEELGIPYEKVTLDMKAGEVKADAFKKINPNAKVPAIVHDGTMLCESAAITLYLGETFGVDRGLFPAPGAKRGQAMMWVVWANVSLGDAFGRWARNTMKWVPADQQNAKAADAALAEVVANLRVLDAHLHGKTFLVGDYTLADTHLNSMVDWLRHSKFDLSAYEHLNAWSKRCSERPAYKRTQG